MGYEMPDRPKFLERALQGLAFWIGHRHSLFNDYPLVEGALVAEACNLIQANLSEKLILRPEVQYRDLIPSHATMNGVSPRARADLTIQLREGVQAGSIDEVFRRTQFVMEFKRGSAPNSLIDEDLRRLYAYQTAATNNARTFLIVVSESKSPTRFVRDGKSKLGTFDVPGCGGVFHVRRTVKAAASFENKTSAHYACLIEVFTTRPRRLPKI